MQSKVKGELVKPPVVTKLILELVLEPYISISDL